MLPSLVQQQAILARTAMIVGAQNFDRLFAGAEISALEGDILHVFAKDEETAAEIEDNYSLHLSIIASQILERDVAFVVVLPQVLNSSWF